MAQRSILWPTTGVGDGLIGGYPDDDLVTVNRFKWINNAPTQGVARDYNNELEITENPPGSIQQDTGGAIVYGYPYWNTTTVGDALVVPLINTTGWRWILRSTWAAQVVRAILVQSADGVAAIPALVQNPGVVWEISLAFGTITVGGVISITDDRTFLGSGSVIDNTHMEDRTMEVLIPAVECETGGVHVPRNVHPEGWPCAAGIDTFCYGSFRIPQDTQIGALFLVDLIFNVDATTATALRLTNTLYLATLGENWNTHWITLTANEPSGLIDDIQVAATVSQNITATVAIGDYVSLVMFRSGSAGADTFAGVMYFMGWRLIYTRDH